MFLQRNIHPPDFNMQPVSFPPVPGCDINKHEFDLRNAVKPWVGQFSNGCFRFCSWQSSALWEYCSCARTELFRCDAELWIFKWHRGHKRDPFQRRAEIFKESENAQQVDSDNKFTLFLFFSNSFKVCWMWLWASAELSTKLIILSLTKEIIFSRYWQPEYCIFKRRNWMYSSMAPL